MMKPRQSITPSSLQSKHQFTGLRSAEESSSPQISLVEYEVTIKTGDVRNAGTDADVSVSLEGSSGWLLSALAHASTHVDRKGSKLACEDRTCNLACGAYFRNLALRCW